MINSGHDLTEVTASFINDNPKVSQWINTFLNKADYQISQVNVSNNLVSIPFDWELPDFGTRFFSQGSFVRETKIKPVSNSKSTINFMEVGQSSGRLRLFID